MLAGLSCKIAGGFAGYTVSAEPPFSIFCVFIDIGVIKRGNMVYNVLWDRKKERSRGI